MNLTDKEIAAICAQHVGKDGIYMRIYRQLMAERDTAERKARKMAVKLISLQGQILDGKEAP